MLPSEITISEGTGDLRLPPSFTFSEGTRSLSGVPLTGCKRARLPHIFCSFYLKKPMRLGKVSGLRKRMLATRKKVFVFRLALLLWGGNCFAGSRCSELFERGTSATQTRLLLERPYTEPYVRWCARTGGDNSPLLPYPGSHVDAGMRSEFTAS